MQTIKTAFTCAASGKTGKSFGLKVIWLMVVAIAILDDGEHRAEKRRKPAPTPRSGPRPF